MWKKYTNLYDARVSSEQHIISPRMLSFHNVFNKSHSYIDNGL